MASNAPFFDPINATPEEEADMVAGFSAAYAGRARPSITSAAWDHGYRVGRHDRNGTTDDDQRILAKRWFAKQRGEPDPFPPDPARRLGIEEEKR